MNIEEYFNTAYIYNPRNNIFWKEIARYLNKRKLIKEDDELLDLGAGYCYFVNQIKCRKKVAVDIYKKFSDFADKTVETHILSWEDLAKLDHLFDVVFASNFFEHLEINEVEYCLRIISKILKPGGRLIAIQPNYRYCYKHYFDDYTHKTIFDHESFCQVIQKQNFGIYLLKPKFMPYSGRKKGILINSFLVRSYLALPVKPLAGQMLVIAQKQ